MIKNRDIIIVGLQAWDNEIGSNCIDIARQFAKHNRVLYVNYPLNRKTVWKEKEQPLVKKRIDLLKNGQLNVFEVEQNIWNFYPSCVQESANFIPSTSLYNIVNRVNNRRLAREIKKAVRHLGFQHFILFNDSDMFRSYYLIELLQPALSVYYSRDNLVGFPYFKKHGTVLEPRLMAKNDIVVANSVYLADVARQYNPHSYYVGQGCDLSSFAKPAASYSRPGDMQNIKGPIVGYMGALLGIRLDVELLEKLAAAKADWQFVLVGPEDEAFQASALHRLANVHFLGLKEMKELPQYLAHFDVTINPQRINEVTIGNYPRKVDEYLAMGKPVVATETKAMNIFDGYVYFANSPEAYAQQIEKALAEDNANRQQARIDLALSHSWENSVAAIYAAMQEAEARLNKTAKHPTLKPETKY